MSEIIYEEFEKEFEQLTEEEKNSVKGLSVLFKHLQKGAKFRIDIAKDPEKGRYVDTAVYVDYPEQIFEVLVEYKAGFMGCTIEGADEYKGVLFYPGMFTYKYFCSKCNHFHKLGIRCSMIALRHLSFKKYEVIS